MAVEDDEKEVVVIFTRPSRAIALSRCTEHHEMLQSDDRWGCTLFKCLANTLHSRNAFQFKYLSLDNLQPAINMTNECLTKISVAVFKLYECWIVSVYGNSNAGLHEPVSKLKPFFALCVDFQSRARLCFPSRFNHDFRDCSTLS